MLAIDDREPARRSAPPAGAATATPRTESEPAASPAGIFDSPWILVGSGFAVGVLVGYARDSFVVRSTARMLFTIGARWFFRDLLERMK